MDARVIRVSRGPSKPKRKQQHARPGPTPTGPERAAQPAHTLRQGSATAHRPCDWSCAASALPRPGHTAAAPTCRAPATRPGARPGLHLCRTAASRPGARGALRAPARTPDPCRARWLRHEAAGKQLLNPGPIRPRPSPAAPLASVGCVRGCQVAHLAALHALRAPLVPPQARHDERFETTTLFRC